jgi:thioredoxin reductase
MKDRSIAIIGAGIGGLSTGCYAQMNGYGARAALRTGIWGGSIHFTRARIASAGSGRGLSFPDDRWRRPAAAGRSRASARRPRHA